MHFSTFESKSLQSQCSHVGYSKLIQSATQIRCVRLKILIHLLIFSCSYLKGLGSVHEKFNIILK